MAHSNLGSMLALLAYPVLVEPNFPLDSQTTLWMAGYGLFAIMVAPCGYMVLQTKEAVVLVPACRRKAHARNRYRRWPPLSPSPGVWAGSG